MDEERSLPKLHNALFTLFRRQFEPAFDFHVHKAFPKEQRQHNHQESWIQIGPHYRVSYFDPWISLTVKFSTSSMEYFLGRGMVSRWKEWKNNTLSQEGLKPIRNEALNWQGHVLVLAQASSHWAL